MIVLVLLGNSDLLFFVKPNNVELFIVYSLNFTLN